MHKGLVLFFTLGFFNIALAQEDVVDMENPPEQISLEQESKSKVPENSQQVEKLEVTGSHIRRIDVEGPNPVMTIDKEALARSGYNSVSDVLRDVGANSFGSFKETGGFVGSGTATVNLRGVGEQRTLVLLNGKRLPTDAINGAVDLNMIPMAAVERVDILKDGASATYGSDALGGVVNIITKKDFEGVEVSLNTSVAELGGGDRRDTSLTYGYFGDSFRSTNVVFLRQNTRIVSDDRAWSRNQINPTGSPGTAERSVEIPGSKDKRNISVADPDCVAGGGTIIPGAGGGTRCGYDFNSTEMPDFFQASVFSDNELQINGTSSAYARIGYNYNQNVWESAPAYAIRPNYLVSAPGKFKGIAGETVRARYRLAEAGNRIQETNTNGASALVGYKKELGDTWQVDSSVSYNRIRRMARRTQGYILEDAYIAKLKSGDFRPFAKAGSRGDLSDIKTVPTKETTSDLGMFNITADGEVGELPAGGIALAVGVQGLSESFADRTDVNSQAGNVVGLATTQGAGSRNSIATFSEVAIPITSTLESQFAIRYDFYSDFGSTVNPKLGMRWNVTNNLALRTSAGTGFRAPAMQDLYKASGTAFPSFVDHVACRDAGYNLDDPSCRPQAYQVDDGGNPNLGEEKSFSANLGAVYQFTRDQSATVDVWYYGLSDLVGIDYNDLTLAESQGADVAASGVQVERSNGEITRIYAPLQNLSSTEIMGIDVSYVGRVKTRIGDFGVNFNQAQLFFFKEEGFPGAGKRNKLGEAGKPVWRNNTALFYFPNVRNEISLLARTIGEHDKIVRAAGEQTTYTEYDLRYALRVFSGSGRFIFSVKNVLNTIPPIDDSNPLDPDLFFNLYDERGRQFALGYRHIF